MLDFDSIGDAADLAAALSPSRGYIIYQHGRRQVLTFEALERRARSRGLQLRDQGIRRGQVVALCIGDLPSFIIGLIAVARIGAVPAPLPLPPPPGSRAEGPTARQRLAQGLWHLRPDWVVADEPHLSTLAKEAATPSGLAPRARVQVLSATPLTAQRALKMDDPGPIRHPHALAQVVPGRGEGHRRVRIGQAALRNNVNACAARLNLNRQAGRSLVVGGVESPAGLLFGVLLPLFQASSAVLVGAADRDNNVAGGWLGLAHREGATIAYLPASAHEATRRELLSGTRALLPALRAIVTDTSTCSSAEVEALAHAVEAAGFGRDDFHSLYVRPDSGLPACLGPAFVSRASARRGFRACGTPLPGQFVTVRDARGRVLPPRATGDVWLHGVASDLAVGHAAQASGRTGDLGYFEGGRLFVASERA